MTLQSWPLFGLRITTPRLELRYVDDDLADGLVRLATDKGVHAPDFMPFSTPWTRQESPEREREGMKFYWRTRSMTTATHWVLPFAVHDDGELVGVQDVGADDFAVRRWVVTGSWLALPSQGKGIGKEMRTAVLHLAFDTLGAEAAETSAFHDNPKSLGVTRSLGYKENGWVIDSREGAAARHLRYVMERSDWQARRRDDITVEGVDDDVRAMLGACPSTTNESP
jgi:RimJ/RimL family protein N-acetyltransferase